MNTTTATKITYRKTKTGEWVTYGPAADIHAGATVTVTKKSGETKTETIDRIGRTFTVDGVEMVYGYIAQSAAPTRRHGHSAAASESCGYPCPVDGHRCTPSNPCHDCF